MPVDLGALNQEIRETRAALMEALHGVTPEQETFKPDSTRWSIRDIADHITIAEESMRRLVRGSIERMRAGKLLYQGAHEHRGLTIQEVMARGFPHKGMAPEMVQPKTNDALSILIDRFAALGHTLNHSTGDWYTQVHRKSGRIGGRCNFHVPMSCGSI